MIESAVRLFRVRHGGLLAYGWGVVAIRQNTEHAAGGGAWAQAARKKALGESWRHLARGGQWHCGTDPDV